MYSVNDLIKEALTDLRVVAEGQNPTAIQTANALIKLKKFLSSLENKKMPMFKQEEMTFTITNSTRVTGTDGNTYRCIKSHTSTNENKPITGSKYQEFWVEETGYDGTPSTWSLGLSYVASGYINISQDADYIIGSDYKKYRCIRDHTSDSTTKPITGEYWQNYWVQDNSFTTTISLWEDATEYTGTPGNDVIKITSAKYRKDESDYFLKIFAEENIFTSFDYKDTGDPEAIALSNDKSSIILNPQPDDDSETIIHCMVELSLNYISNGNTSIELPDRYYNLILLGLKKELCQKYSISFQEKEDIRRDYREEEEKIFERDFDKPKQRTKRGTYDYYPLRNGQSQSNYRRTGEIGRWIRQSY